MGKNRLLSQEGIIGSDVIERIAYITSELDQIVDITKHKEKPKDTVQLQNPF